ncbi:MAG: hypothetical protein ND866_30595 [Pyrinomonadaceae bacterium]|nr:hypothetical protein [Pyrinomonadaceae bacterium]
MALPTPPPIAAGNALLINESCPPANGEIDPGERVTVNLELMNTSNAATSNLVATLQSSGGVLAPSGPQSYGAIAVNSSAARDFAFTVPANISSGQTITATLQLQDGTNNQGTVSFNFTAGPAPCSFVRSVVTSSLSRANASTVVGAITVQNIGSLAASNVTLATARLGATNGTPLPQGLGNLAPGQSATVMVNFSNSTPGASSMLTVGGTYDGGSFSSNKRVTIPACSPGAPGCGWQDGDMVTYNQDNWGGDPGTSTAAGILAAHFDSIYGGGVEVGVSGNTGFSMIFTSVAALLNYLPSSGPPAPLNADLVDPTSTSSGLLGGYVLALQFNVDFADAGRISGTSGLVYGDLRLCGLSSTTAYNGLTIRQFLAEMNTALGAGPVAYTYDDVAALTSDVSTAFESGTVNPFAQQHLVSGPACP